MCPDYCWWRYIRELFCSQIEQKKTFARPSVDPFCSVSSVLYFIRPGFGMMECSSSSVVDRFWFGWQLFEARSRLFLHLCFFSILFPHISLPSLELTPPSLIFLWFIYKRLPAFFASMSFSAGAIQKVTNSSRLSFLQASKLKTHYFQYPA